MEKNLDRNDAIKKLNELIKDVQFGMLTTVSDEGYLHSRPMAKQRDPFDGTLWFFTYLRSGKTAEVEKDEHVNVSFSKPEDNTYVSLSGLARTLQDKQKSKDLWNDTLKAYFPKGLDDPNLALLKIDVHQAEYWDSPSSSMVQLFGYLKAVTTGKKYEDEGSDHKKVEL